MRIQSFSISDYTTVAARRPFVDSMLIDWLVGWLVCIYNTRPTRTLSRVGSFLFIIAQQRRIAICITGNMP